MIVVKGENLHLAPDLEKIAKREQVEELVREEINPRDSWRASKAFRLQIGGEIAKRALKESVRRGMVTGVVVPDVRTTSGENMSSNGKIYPSSDAENVTGGEQS